MVLAIDIGNTNMVFGFFDEGVLLESFRMTTKKRRTGDELGLTLLQYLQCLGRARSEVEAVLVSSVVSRIMPMLKKAIWKYFGFAPLVVYEDLHPTLFYEATERLGADRAVACEAAVHKYGKPLVLLDLGTATTIDTVREDFSYGGGCILAGVGVCAEALYQKAEQLPQVPLQAPPQALGFDAVGQIQGGAVLGYLGGMEYLIRCAKTENAFAPQTPVVATGGYAPLLHEAMPGLCVLDEGLILEGLCILYEKTKQQAEEGVDAP